MLIVCLSDVHLSWEVPEARKDDYFATGLRKFEYVLKWCKDNDVRLLLQAGDLTDKPRSWYVLPSLLKILKQYNESGEGITLCTVSGQHDQYFRSSSTRPSTMLGILEETEYVIVLGEDPVIHLGVWVYGAGWGETVPMIEEDKAINVLVTHDSISDAELYPGQEYTNAEEYLDSHPDFGLIVCGDTHKKFIVEKEGRILVNTGPMLRKEATLYNFDHEPCFYVYDTEKKQGWFEIIPHVKAERVLTRDHIETGKDRLKILEEFVNSVGLCKVDYSVSFEENLDRIIKENSIEEDVVKIIESEMAYTK